ncbi:hypothetical protein GCM10022259_32960 [Aquimarina mytili]
MKFPLIFARSLPYKGEEHIRFAKGWGDTTSEEYFSYVFVWILDESSGFTADKIKENMDIYFTGLMKTGLIIKLRFFKRLPKTLVMISEDDPEENSYKGKIRVYDAFFKKEEINLNSKVSISYCKKIDKHLVFFRLSPKEFEHAIWKDLDDVRIKFDCNLM